MQPAEQPTPTEQPTLTATAPVQPIEQPTAAPATTTAAPVPTVSGGHSINGDTVDPPWWPCQEGQIKGNKNSKIYHVPSGQFYDKTYENVECFNTEEAARAAGYRRSKR